jgi:hypothetical protein
MDVLALIIAVVALVIAVSAFRRTGGGLELKRRAQGLSSTTAPMRDRTADALNRLEQLVRGKERPKPGERSDPPPGAEPR